MLSPRSETLAAPVKSSVFVKSVPHCDWSKVHHVEVLALRLKMRPGRGEEMDVRVPAVPALGVHVRPSLEAELQLALAGLDGDLRSEGFVLETARHVDDDLSARQPPLARAVDVGECRLTEPQIASHVVVPRPQVRVDLIVVTVGLVGHAVRRAEVDAAGHGTPSLVVDDRDVHPVLAGVDKLDLDLLGLHCPAVDHLAPGGLANLGLALFHGHGRRRRGRYLHVGRAGSLVVVLPPGIRGGEELVGRHGGQGEDVGGIAPVHLDFDIERLGGVGLVEQGDLSRTASLSRERVLVKVPQGDSRYEEAHPRGDDFDGLYGRIGFGVLPRPEPAKVRRRLGRLGLASSGLAELALVAGHQDRFAVGYSAVRRARRSRREGRTGRNLEAFADIHSLLPAARQGEHVLRDRLAESTALGQLRFQQRVSEQHPLCGLADRNGDATPVRRGRNE